MTDRRGRAQGPDWHAAAARAAKEVLSSNATERAALKLLRLSISASEKRAQAKRVRAFQALVKTAPVQDLQALSRKIKNETPGLGKLFDLEMSGGFNRALLRWIGERVRKEEQNAKRGTRRPLPNRGTKPRPPQPPVPPRPREEEKKKKEKDDEEKKRKKDDEKIPDVDGPEFFPDDLGDGGLLDKDVPGSGAKSWLRRALSVLGYGAKVGAAGLLIFNLPSVVISLSVNAARAKLLELAVEAGLEALSNNDKISANRLKKMIGEAAESGARVVVEYLEEGAGRLTTAELIDLNEEVKFNFAGLDLLSKDVPVQIKARGVYGLRGFRIDVKVHKNGALRLGLSKTDDWVHARAYARDFLRLIDQSSSERWKYNRGGGGGNTAAEMLKYRKRLSSLDAWPRGKNTKEELQDWLTKKAVLVVPKDHLVKARGAVGEMLYQRWKDGKLSMFEGLTETQVVERISAITGRVRSMGLGTNDLRVMAELAMNQEQFRNILKF